MMSRKLETLDEYIKLFNTKNLQEETNLFSVLRTGFGGDGDFAILVSRAIARPYSQDMYSNAKKYQKALLQRWEKSDLEPMGLTSKVFVDVGENNKAHVDSIISQYKTFYNKARGLN